MNTPAHAIMGLALLGRTGERGRDAAILAGSLLPDLPMFGFFIYQRFVLDNPQRQIWDIEYFRAGWQLLFDLFNSIPLAGLGLGLAIWLRRTRTTAFFGAVLIHCVVDLALHHDDGHRHFLPLSEFRFESPVSYWDPAHYGLFGAGLEGMVLVGAGAVLWTRYEHPAARWAVLILCALHGLGYGAFYLLR